MLKVTKTQILQVAPKLKATAKQTHPPPPHPTHVHTHSYIGTHTEFLVTALFIVRVCTYTRYINSRKHNSIFFFLHQNHTSLEVWEHTYCDY